MSCEAAAPGDGGLFRFYGIFEAQKSAGRNVINHEDLTHPRPGNESLTMMARASPFAVWGQKHGAGMARARSYESSDRGDFARAYRRSTAEPRGVRSGSYERYTRSARPETVRLPAARQELPTLSQKFVRLDGQALSRKKSSSRAELEGFGKENPHTLQSVYQSRRPL